MRTVQKISRRLGRAADAGHLGHIFRLNAHLIHRVDNALCDGVVSAAGAQRGLAAAIIQYSQANMICLRTGSGRRCSSWSGGHYLASWETIASVTERASMGRPL